MIATTTKFFAIAAAMSLFLVFGVSGRLRSGDPPARSDRFGDPLPKDALVRIGSIRFRVEGYVAAVAFSPDGKWLAASDSCGLVYLWEADTAKVIRQFDTRERSPAVFFSPDGKSLGTRTALGEVRLWDADSGRPQASIQRQRRGNEYYGEQLLLSPDRSRLLVVGDANAMIAVHNGKHADAYVIGRELPELSIDLLELPSGKLVKQLAKNTAETIFSDAALSPDGRLLAVGIRAYKAPRKLLRLIDAASGALVREIKGQGEGWFLSVTFSRDGKTLALGSKDEIELVDVATGKMLDRLTAKMTTVSFLGFSPEAKTLISHSHDNKVRLWDVAAKKVLRQFDADADGHSVFPLPTGIREPAHVEHFGRSNSTALSPDGKTIAVGIHGCVQIWDAVAGKQLFPEQIPADGWGKVAFSPDNRLLLVGTWKHSRLWDSVTGEVSKELPAGTAWGVFSPDGTQLAFARYPQDEDKEAPAVSIWDIAAQKELCKLAHPRKERFCFEKLAFGPDGRTLLTLSTHVENAGYPNCAMVHRWDLGTGKRLGSIHRKDTNAWPSAIAADGRTAAIVLGRGILLIDVPNDEDLWTRADGTPEEWSGYPVFSPDDGFVFVWSRDGYVGMWEITTRSVISRLRLHRDGNIKLARWPVPDKNSKGEEREMAFDQADIQALAVSPDGRFVATSEQFDNRHHRASSAKPTPLPIIRIWEAATGTEVQRLEGFRSAPLSLAFAPDGRRLASAFHNDTVLVWDVSRIVRPVGARKKLTPDQMQKLWEEFALADGAKAYSAMTALQEAPDEVVDFLKRHVRPVPAADAKRVQQLIQGLDSKHFAERDRSDKELRTLAPRFRASLRKAVKESASLEIKRRLETVLSEAPRQLPLESLRTLRCIQVLERIGSTEARQFLSALADGAPEAHETLTAQTALQRLKMRPRNDQ